MKKVGVILLLRDEQSIISSFYSNRESPGFDIFANVWNINPGCTMTKIVNKQNKYTHEGTIQWQINEIYERAKIMKENYPNIQFYEVQLEKLNTLEVVENMFHFFGLKISEKEKLLSIIGNPCNTGSERSHNSECKETFSFPKLPNDPIFQSKEITKVIDYILSKKDSSQIRMQKRAILGDENCISCMVGAKLVINELHDEICEKILKHEFDFTDFRWNLTCKLVEVLDPNDPMFRFVTKIGNCKFILDGLNIKKPFYLKGYENMEFFEKNNKKIEPINHIKVCVSGACGRIAPHLIYRLINEANQIFSNVKHLEISLLVKDKQKLKMEGILEDLIDSFNETEFSYNFEIETQSKTAFSNCDIVILCASSRRLPHYERYHLAIHQKELYKQHAIDLNNYTNENCKIVVVANPVITIANFMMQEVPEIANRITGITDIDERRACSHLTSTMKKLLPNANHSKIFMRNIQILGNHSDHLWVDCSGCEFIDPLQKITFSADELIGHDYLTNELQEHVRHRGRSIIIKTDQTALFSTVTSIINHLHFILGNSKNKINSIQSIGIYINNKNFLEKWNFHPLTKDIIIPSTIQCMIFPCKINHDDILEIDFQSIIRALYWDLLAGQALHASIKELVMEYNFMTSGDFFPMGRTISHRISIVKNMLEQSEYILIFAGAGMSVSSGIPDITKFSDAFPAAVKRGINSIFDISSHKHFIENPASAWGFWISRAKSYAKISPDDSYHKLLQICNNKNYFVVTSNIDRLFTKAGFSENQILEVHGSLFDIQCQDSICKEKVIRDQDFFINNDIQIDEDYGIVLNPNKIPSCSICCKPKRIATEFAVDGHYVKDLVHAQRNRYKEFLRNIPVHANVTVLEVGCGVVMSSIRERAARFARVRNLTKKGGLTKGETFHVRINIQHWDIEDITNSISIPLSAKQTFSALV